MDGFISEIEAFCAMHGMRESRFGRDAANDASLVADLRNGREPRRATVERIRRFMTALAPECPAV
jgi:hypothetical protein